MKKDKSSIIIIIILVVVAIIAYFILGGAGNNYKKLKDLVVNTKSGQKIQTEYSSIGDNKFYIKVPTSFKEMNSEEKEIKYSDAIPAKAYKDDKDKINIAIDLTKEKISEEEILPYKDKKANYYKDIATLKSAFIEKIDGHNVVKIEYMDKNMYYHIMYFSYNGHLGTVIFSCSMDDVIEWQPVGDFIIDSIYFK